jgi:hypothetical protein
MVRTRQASRHFHFGQRSRSASSYRDRLPCSSPNKDRPGLKVCPRRHRSSWICSENDDHASKGTLESTDHLSRLFFTPHAITGRDYIGIELDAIYHAIASTRLEATGLNARSTPRRATAARVLWPVRKFGSTRIREGFKLRRYAACCRVLVLNNFRS